MRNGARRTEAGDAYEAAAFAHHWYGVLRERVQRKGVRLHAASPVLYVHFQCRSQYANRGVAHHYVDFVELFAELAKRFGHTSGITYICLCGKGAPALGADGL